MVCWRRCESRGQVFDPGLDQRPVPLISSNLYYIDNPDALENDSVNQWLLDSFAVSNLLMDNRSISDRIMLEDVPSGRYYLEIITSAMRENRQIVIDYEDFFGNTIQGLKVNPYFIRLFKRRWYVMALVMPRKDRRTDCRFYHGVYPLTSQRICTFA